MSEKRLVLREVGGPTARASGKDSRRAFRRGPHDGNANARFGATVGGLTTGRVLIASAAVEGIKLAAVVALRYSARRPQFGDAIVLELPEGPIPVNE